MTFAQILADVYRRTGFSSSPAADVQTRIKAFVNEVQQDILSEDGMEFLLNDTITLSSVANQATYGLPLEVSKIKAIRDTANLYTLAPMSLGEYRDIYPDPSVATGTSRRWVDLGFDGIDTEPSDASTLFVLSSSAGDTGSAYIEGFRSGGVPFKETITMTGTTAATSVTTDIISITKFYLSTAAVGTVTLREDSGSGTVLATIPPAATYSRYRRIALVPTPSTTAIVYQLDCERVVTDMVNDTDEPVIPPQFHRMLAIGARAKEYEKQNQLQRWTVARNEFDKELKKLKFWLFQHSVGTPNLRGTGYVRGRVEDGNTIASASSAASTPLAATAGGTGFASYSIGDLLYADTATSLAKLSDVATGKVLRSGGVGVAPAYGQVNLATDVTGDLPFANLTQGSALSVLGVTGNATADVASIAAASDGQVLRRSGTAVAFGAVDLASANAITGDLPFANLTQGSALSVLGVTGNATADNASIAAGSDHQVLRRSGTAVAFGAVNLAQSAAVTGVLPTANGGTNVDIASAALVLGSGQLSFPATQNPSSGVNVLDDYEEGTWTPVIGGSGGTSGQTYTTQVGSYIKIGKLVLAHFFVLLSAKGTITTNVQIQGLPFTSENTANQFSYSAFRYSSLGTNWVSVGAFVNVNATTADVQGAAAAATSNATALATGDITNTTQFIGTLIYRAAA